ncbi:MAG: DNA translocase FtsK [Saprospiraceae bacterium]|nr:DNA translocase FtsK [Saprospiraceae bacterium]
MAKSKKKKTLSARIGIKDERFPKLVGLLLLFLTLYLFIAYTSYLFTWKLDQDKAYGAILLQPHDMHNWLGRLGAVISRYSFEFGFGVSSFMFVFLLFQTGMSKITGTALKELIPTYKRGAVFVIWTSILLEFIFQNSEFQWGGAFGKAIIFWLSNLVGTAGIIILLIFLLFGILIWSQNPNLENWSSAELKKSIQPKNLINSVQNLGKFLRPTPEKETKPKADLVAANPEDISTVTTTSENSSDKAIKTLRPQGGKRQNVIDNTTPPKDSEEEATAEKADNEKQAPQVTREELEQRVKELTKNQLQLNIDKTAKDKTKKNKEDKEKLEIEISKDGGQHNLMITQENTEHIEPYDPTLDLPRFENPVLDLLESYDDKKPIIDRTELEANKDQIIETLLNYKIEIVKIQATIGPTVTLYEIVPAPGVRIAKIKNLEDDIALSLAALGIRIIAPIPGRGTIGIEVPNRNKQIVSLKEVLSSPKYRTAKMDLPIALGKSISDEVFVADLAKMPHLLVAGATGQGKSVGVNTIIMSLLYKKHPSQLKLVLIDPKKVELSLYNKISHHYLSYLPEEEEAIVTDTSKVVQTLHSLTVEMDDRYNLLKKAGVRNLKEYNQKFVKRRLNPEKGHHFLPYIVLVIDEFADLIMTAGKEVELPIGRLAQLARAVGIHLIIATQRPSVNIITGVIKANFPARLAFKVTSKIDSRTILDTGGAEQLIGRGDMLLSTGGETIRLQCAFVDTPEVERIINYISDQRGYPQPFFLPAYGSDDESDSQLKQVLTELDQHFEDAARLVVINQQGSTSMLQRRLKLGYNRAGRIMDQLEHTGIVGPNEGSKARQVYIHDEVELEEYLKTLRSKQNKAKYGS